MAHSTIENWLNTSVGKPMDPDGAYGYQCVDLVDQYAQDIFGVRWQTSVGGVGGANELLDRVPDEFWIRIDNDPNDPNLIPIRGDVIVWAGDAANKWGHVAVVLGADANGVNVIQQDGGQNWRPSHTAWLQYHQWGTGHVMGWLRPKEHKLIGYIPPSQPKVVPASVPAANIRTTNQYGVNRRKAPDKNGEFVDNFGPGLDITIGGYVIGTDPYGDGNNIWFVGGLSGGYMHSSGFTNPSKDGFKQLPWNLPTAVVTPDNPTPAVPTVPAYTFDLDFHVINGINVEKIPANNTNVDTGNIGANVTDLVDHWWNNIANRPSIGSVINEFTREASYKSPHWIVGEDRVIQMVSIKDRAYHAGPKGNIYYGVEIDPLVTEKDALGEYTDRAKKIQANVKALHSAIEGLRHATVTAHLHKEFMATECAGIDLTTVLPDTLPSPTPDPVPAPVTTDNIREFFEWLETEFRNRNK